MKQETCISRRKSVIPSCFSKNFLTCYVGENLGKNLGISSSLRSGWRRRCGSSTSLPGKRCFPEAGPNSSGNEGGKCLFCDGKRRKSNCRLKSRRGRRFLLRKDGGGISAALWIPPGVSMSGVPGRSFLSDGGESLPDNSD